MFLGKSLLGSRSARGYEFGRTYVVRPKGKHQATIVLVARSWRQWLKVLYRSLSHALVLILMINAHFISQIIKIIISSCL